MRAPPKEKYVVFSLKDSNYTYIIGSDISRDGMYLEISKQLVGAEAILEVFYSDQTHEMTVTTFNPDVPLELVEWAISVAKKRLPVSK